MKMKRIVLLVLGLFFLQVEAQNVTSLQLKSSRTALYDWFQNYKSYSLLDGRTARARFQKLFESGDVLLYNDYLPDTTFNFKDPYLSVLEYIEVYKQRECFDFRIMVPSIRIVSEKERVNAIVYEVEFDKVLSFIEKDNYDLTRLEYPEKIFHCKVELVYNLYNSEMKAKGITVSNPIKPFAIVHNNTENRYINADSVPRSNKISTVVFERYYPSNLDKKIIVAQRDTLKNAFGMVHTIGKTWFKPVFLDNRYSDVYGCDTAQYSIGFSYYRQLWLKNNNRIGICTGIQFNKSRWFIAANYHDNYNMVDPDGMEYERLVDIDNYKEEIGQHTWGVPIMAKYNHFLGDIFDVYAQLGVTLNVSRLKTLNAMGDAYYRGFYEELFNVTIDQNGVYDFGRYHLSVEDGDWQMNPFSMSFVSSIGGSAYWNQWQLSMGVLYFGKLWYPRNLSSDSKLSDHDGDWSSATNAMWNYKLNNVSFQLQLIYNF